MSTQRQLIRVSLILGYILAIFLVLFGVSKVISYLNTGADRSKMLHTDIKKVAQYLPKLEWQPLKNEGRLVSKTILASIENDYLDAWYVKNIAYQTNLKSGIEDYYTKSARKNLYNIIANNKENKITIESTTLAHNLIFDFFSEDGQLAVVTDKNVLEFKRIFKEDKLISEVKEVTDYKIIFLLEDGFWRIRHQVKIASKPFIDNSKPVDIPINILKGINYYPQKNPWDMYNDDFDISVISKDFKIIKDAGLNTIRIFVPYEDFGKATVKNEKLEKLNLILNEASNNNLKVMVTLFDFYGDYSVINWTLNQRHAEIIINRFKNHPAVLAWDIKNEPNLDFESRGEALVTSWLDYFIYFIKNIDKTHPVTVGWSNVESASILADKLDFISFHYYEDLNELSKVYQNIRTENPQKNIAITEFGLSSYSGIWNLFSRSKEKQLLYYKEAQEIFKENNIPFYSWTLYDFKKIPKEVIGKLPWRVKPQKEFGFIDIDGNKKPSFSSISK